MVAVFAGLLFFMLCIDSLLFYLIKNLNNELEFYKKISKLNFSLLENSVNQLISEVYKEKFNDVPGSDSDGEGPLTD